MKIPRMPLAVAALAVALTLLGVRLVSRQAAPAETAEARVQPLIVRAIYEGTVESRQTVTVTSKCSGGAVLSELIPEGSVVKQGDVIARFGSSQLEREILKAERDEVSMRVALETLRDAKFPLDTRAIDTELAERRSDLATEQRALADTQELAKEDLVPREEVDKQLIRIKRLESQIEGLEQKRELTVRHIQPALLREAEANLEAARQALELARAQAANCVVKAPADGTVVYTPLHIGTEFRVARIGDTVYENQPFLLIPDTAHLMFECLVPEAELSRVQAGRPVYLEPLSFPGLRVNGQVEWISSMAQQVSGQPFWQRFFRVRIAIADSDPRLRPGLTAHAHVVAYENPKALVVPRRAVEWRDGAAICRRVSAIGGIEPVTVRTGQADTTFVEILDGLKPGDRVRLE